MRPDPATTTTADPAPYAVLSDGNRIPRLGLGTLHLRDPEKTVRDALAIGYRHIDTASLYGNEEAVGAGIARSAVPRDEIFVTTKLHNPDQGFESVMTAFHVSRGLLGLDHLDLYLIHWPAPRLDRFVESWRAIVRLQEEGWIRSIGVSNFRVDDLQRLVAEVGVAPVVNQIELHPSFAQRELSAAHERLAIRTQAWSPLGGRGDLENDVIAEIARETGRTRAQVVLRWHLDAGRIAIPKSDDPRRLRENFDLFDFLLDPEQTKRIALLDSGNRLGGHPDLIFE